MFGKNLSFTLHLVHNCRIIFVLPVDLKTLWFLKLDSSRQTIASCFKLFKQNTHATTWKTESFQSNSNIYYNFFSVKFLPLNGNKRPISMRKKRLISLTNIVFLNNDWFSDFVACCSFKIYLLISFFQFTKETG